MHPQTQIVATVHNYPPDRLINTSSAPSRSVESENLCLCRQNPDFRCRKEALAVHTGCFLTPFLLFRKTDSIIKQQFEFRHIFCSVCACVCLSVGLCVRREKMREKREREREREKASGRKQFFHHDIFHQHCFFSLQQTHTHTHTHTHTYEDNPPQLTLPRPVNTSFTCKHCC